MKNPKPVPTSNCALLASIIIHHLNEGHFVMEKITPGIVCGESFLNGSGVWIHLHLTKKDTADVSIRGLTVTIQSKELAEAMQKACQRRDNKRAQAFVSEAKASQIFKEMGEGGAR